MAAAHSHFDGAFDVALTFHIAEIDVVRLMRGKKSGQISARGQQRGFAAQKSKRLSQILHPIDVDIIDHGGFERIGFRDKECTLTSTTRFQRHRQHAFHRAHGAI